MCWNKKRKPRKERVEKICVTCQHYEPYHCKVDNHYIGYVQCETPIRCKAYRLRDSYQKGGKFYDDRLDALSSG